MKVLKIEFVYEDFDTRFALKHSNLLLLYSTTLRREKVRATPMIFDNFVG